MSGRGDIVRVVGGERGAQGPGASSARAAQDGEALQEHGVLPERVWELPAGQVLLPGFVDVHVHAPQYSYTGTATDLPLMEWLERYTFPTERRLGGNAEEAADVFRTLVKRLLLCGTTTAMYFGTTCPRISCLLADTCAAAGQRALVGKVNMDRQAPDNYLDPDAAASIAGSEALIRHVRAKGLGDLLLPVLTPRFIPTCSKELLRRLGDLAASEGVHVQSHISESDDEVAFVQSLHPDEGGDAAIFDAANLLTNRAVMAHGTHLSTEDLELLRARGTAVAHCPLSNFFFAGRSFVLKHALKLGVKVGLGTDVAGGVSPSMLVAMRAAVHAGRVCVHAEAARLRSEDGPDAKRRRCENREPAVGGAAGAAIEAAAAAAAEAERLNVTWVDALWLGTQGGADALAMGHRLGSFDEGKALDALAIDLCCDATFDAFPTDSLRDKLEKFFHLGDDRNIVKRFVQGRDLGALS